MPWTYGRQFAHADVHVDLTMFTYVIPTGPARKLTRKQGHLPRAVLSPTEGEGDAKAFSSEAFPTSVYSAPSDSKANDLANANTVRVGAAVFS